MPACKGPDCPEEFEDYCNSIDDGDDDFDCLCSAANSESNWISNLEDNEEPKWGQLANKQEILNEISNISGLNSMSYEDQLSVLVSHFEKNLMYSRENGELVIVDNTTDVNRYVYSEIGGWIDFHHVFRIYQWASENGPFSAQLQGELGEMWQSLRENHSAYSYEDLPSNAFGVGLFVNYSEQLYFGTITWYEVIELALNQVSCIEPELAPNFNYIPHIVNEFYPQNFTYTPLLGESLKEYHKQKFCERPIIEQQNIKEAHENFRR